MSPNKLFTVRLLLILFASAVCGAVIGSLTYLAGDNVPTAVIAGLVTFGGAIAFFNNHVDNGPGDQGGARDSNRVDVKDR